MTTKIQTPIQASMKAIASEAQRAERLRRELTGDPPLTVDQRDQIGMDAIKNAITIGTIHLSSVVDEAAGEASHSAGQTADGVGRSIIERAIDHEGQLGFDDLFSDDAVVPVMGTRPMYRALKKNDCLTVINQINTNIEHVVIKGRISVTIWQRKVDALLDDETLGHGRERGAITPALFKHS